MVIKNDIGKIKYEVIRSNRARSYDKHPIPSSAKRNSFEITKKIKNIKRRNKMGIETSSYEIIALP